MSSNNRKTLLVLAASLYQLETIETTRRLGLRVITTDNRPDNPGHARADRAYGADTRDEEAVLAIARAEHIAGVIAPCTDVAMPTAATVAAELGLPGPPVQGTRIVCDKGRFRDFQAARGLPHPRFQKLRKHSTLNIQHSTSNSLGSSALGSDLRVGSSMLNVESSEGVRGKFRRPKPRIGTMNHAGGAPVSDPARWLLGSKRAGSETGAPVRGEPQLWIVKPGQSSGSKGIRVVSGAEELTAALEAAFPFSQSSEVIVEEFLPGHQGTCEGWLSAGRIAWHCLLDRQTVALPFVATNGHHLPTVRPPADQQRVLDAIAEVWRHLGVTDGPFDCDFVVNPEAVFILELSPRLGGNSISQLVRLAYDFDLVERAVRWATREELPPLPAGPPRPCAVVILGADRAGDLSYREAEAARLARAPWVRSLVLDHAPGTRVEPFTDGRRRVGQALLVAETRTELDRRAAELRASLAITAT